MSACRACGEGRGKAAGGKLLKCGKCNVMHYCSKVCQVADWPSHKLQCKELQWREQRRLTHLQILTDEVGTGAATAYKAWMKRAKPLIVEAAAAVLWPAPHLTPRNLSHGLLLHVSYDNSARPPQFRVERFEELTLEEISAMAARANGGENILWPDDFPPDSMTMKVIVSCSNLGHEVVLRSFPSFLTSALVATIKDGKMKLPTADEAFARINMLS